MPLTTIRNTREYGLTGVGVIDLAPLPVAAAVTIFQGAMLSVDTSGNIRPTRATATDRVLGRAPQTVDNSGGSAGALESAAERGTFLWGNSAAGDEITDVHIGATCYAVDDETVALTDGTGSRPVAGRIAGIVDGQVAVEMGVASV